MGQISTSIVLDVRMMRHSGIGVYLRGLLGGICRLLDAPRFVFIGPTRFRHEVPERLCELYVLIDNPIYSLQEQFLFPESLRFAPIFHAPHYNIPLRFRGRLVVTIHDMNHLVFAKSLPTPLHRLYARFMFGEVAARATHIITDTDHMRHEVIERLKVAPERVSAIPLAVTDNIKPVRDATTLSEFRKKHNLPERYLLAVGIYKPHKNYDFLIKTLAGLWRSGRLDMPLAIATPRVKDRERLNALAAGYGAIDQVRLIDYTGMEELVVLYSGAEALLFPSLYEGFGFPPLEAMKCETPVLASNLPPMPEVLGDAALFFNPASSEEFSEALLRLIGDSALRAVLIDRGRRNVLRFSWEKTAQATLNVYKQVLESEG
jgi:glycosyltransferase involved in cell wall biosynthesis